MQIYLTFPVHKFFCCRLLVYVRSQVLTYVTLILFSMQQHRTGAAATPGRGGDEDRHSDCDKFENSADQTTQDQQCPHGNRRDNTHQRSGTGLGHHRGEDPVRLIENAVRRTAMQQNAAATRGGGWGGAGGENSNNRKRPASAGSGNYNDNKPPAKRMHLSAADHGNRG